MKVTIEYVVKGRLKMDEDAYIEYASGGELDWPALSNDEKIALVKECEVESNGCETLIEDAANNGKPEITSVIIE